MNTARDGHIASGRDGAGSRRPGQRIGVLLSGGMLTVLMGRSWVTFAPPAIGAGGIQQTAVFSAAGVVANRGMTLVVPPSEPPADPQATSPIEEIADRPAVLDQSTDLMNVSTELMNGNSNGPSSGDAGAAMLAPPMMAMAAPAAEPAPRGPSAG